MRFIAVLVFAALMPLGAQIPAGTRLEIQLAARTRISSAGQPLTAVLGEPVYAGNRIALPAGTPVAGVITTVHGPRWWKRVWDGFGGDFSPTPSVHARFDRLQLPDGTWTEIAVAPAAAAPTVHMVTAGPTPSRGQSLERQISGLYHRQEDAAEAFARSQTQWTTVKQEAVASLPYHPNYLAPGAVFSEVLTAPIAGSESSAPAPVAAPVPLPPALVLHARLDGAVSSASARWGDPVTATLDRPALGSDGAVVVPQGAKLEGHVVEAKRARWLGRGGKLRFVFTRVDVPGAASEEVSTTLAGAGGSAGQQMNDEGEVRAPAPSRAGAALALSLVASAAIHSDADNAWSLDAGSGTHLQIWGPIAAALLPRLQPLALGMGFAGAGETIYTHLLGRGGDVAFPAATELEIRVNPKQP